MRYFYLFWWNCVFKRQNSFVGFERFTRLTQSVGCVAFVTICLRLTLGKSTHCRPDQKILTVVFTTVLIFSKRGERMRQSAKHIYVPHGNEVYVNNWHAWRIRRRTIRKIIKTGFFNTSFYRFLLLFVEAESPPILKKSPNSQHTKFKTATKGGFSFVF
mgnify:CR=1 FL=1